MFFWAEQQLESLPLDEAAWQERGDTWRLERICCRLKSVETTERFVHKRQTGVVEEDRVVIASD